MEAEVTLTVSETALSDEARAAIRWVADRGSLPYWEEAHADLVDQGLLEIRFGHDHSNRVVVTKKGLREAEVREESSWYISRTHLYLVQAKAAELGLDVAVADVSPDTVWHFWGYSNERLYHHVNGAAIKARATAVAADLCHVTVTRPRHEDRVIAVAVNEGGFPTFSDLPGEKHWTPETISTFDFKHCDVCGKKIARKNIYVVENLSGERRHIGGDCALNLDLARKVKRFFKALQELRAYLSSSLDEDEGFCFGSSKEYPGSDPHTLYVLFEAMRSRYGYVSGKAAREGTQPSTRERGMDLLWTSRRRVTSSTPSWVKDEIREARAEMAHFEAEAERRHDELEADVTVFVEEKWARSGDAFAANLRAAWNTGAWRLAGLVAWLPEGVAKEQERKAANRAYTPYDPDLTPVTGADLLAWAAKYPQGVVDLGIEEKTLAKAAKKPEANIAKALANKIERYVPGNWTVIRVGSFEGTFGTTYFFTMVREDGRSVTWRTTTPHTTDGTRVEQGKAYRIVSAGVKDVPKPRTLRTGAVVQDGRSIERASVVLVP